MGRFVAHEESQTMPDSSMTAESPILFILFIFIISFKFAPKDSEF